jgi:hypothetical protein
MKTAQLFPDEPYHLAHAYPLQVRQEREKKCLFSTQCMGMVTLVQQQQQQQASDESYQYHQRQEQDRANGVLASAESHVINRSPCDEVAHKVAGTHTVPVVVSGNGSIEGSSTQCSDVDEDDDEDEEEIEENGSGSGDGGSGWITNLSAIPSTAVVQQAVSTANGDLVLPSADPSSFGDVCVKNSTNVHLGNKTFYKGPVTIKQFVYTNPALAQDVQVKLETDHGTVSNISDLPSTNKSNETANESILPQNAELNKGNASSYGMTDCDFFIFVPFSLYLFISLYFFSLQRTCRGYIYLSVREPNFL